MTVTRLNRTKDSQFFIQSETQLVIVCVPEIGLADISLEGGALFSILTPPQMSYCFYNTVSI